MIFVSVIIPTYNRADYIRQAVDSVLALPTDQVEVIVIDDGSNDNTKEVLEDHITANKIIYQWQQNAGRSEARNNGARISKGEFLLFLDSDDKLHEKAIENFRQLTFTNPRSGVFGGRVMFFSNEEPLWEIPHFNYSHSFYDKQIIADASGNIFLSTGAYILRREIFLKNNGFVKEFEPAEDLDFSIKSLHAGLFTWSKDFIVVNKRRHIGNTSDKELYKASFRISSYYIKEIRANRLPNFNKEKSKLLSNLYERLLNDCINLNMKWTGTKYFCKMIGRDRTKIISPSKWKLFLYLLFFSGRNKSA